MNGETVTKIRNKSKLTVSQLADLLGVDLSTVYRWESSSVPVVKIDPQPLRILQILESVGSKIDLRMDISTLGGLYGLMKLLNEYYEAK